MKICFVTTGYFPIPPTKGGAVENLVYSLVKKNEEYSKHQMTVFSSYDLEAKLKSKKFTNTNFIYVKTPKICLVIDKVIYTFVSKVIKKEKNLSFRYLVQRLYFEYIVSRKISKLDFDKIIIENTPASFLSIKWSKNKEELLKKTVYHIHNEVGNGFGCDKLIAKVNNVIGISEFVNRKFKERFPEFKGKCEVLYNCITEHLDEEPSESEIEQIRKKYMIEKDDFLILFVGRLSSEKGVLELIKAFNLLTIQKAKLLIVGGAYYGSNVSSPYERQLHDEAKGNIDRIQFLGYVDRSKIDYFYRAADAVVLPSMWEEPAGLTIIESMLSKTPVITTNGGGILEYIGEDNCIVLNRDENIVNAIADEIMNVYENTLKYNKMAEKACYFAKKYNDDNYYKHFCEIMEKLNDESFNDWND